VSTRGGAAGRECLGEARALSRAPRPSIEGRGGRDGQISADGGRVTIIPGLSRSEGSFLPLVVVALVMWLVVLPGEVMFVVLRH
jgi:hypothetical protein